MQRIYDQYDKVAEVEMVQIDAPHNYNAASREAVYRFFGKRIHNDSGARPGLIQVASAWELSNNFVLS